MRTRARIAACGAAVVSFSHTAVIAAALALVLVLVLYAVEVAAVSKATVRELNYNPLRRAFVPIALGQVVLALVVVAMLFITSSSLRMQGGGMSPGLVPGQRLAYRKTVEPTRLRAGGLILFRLNPDNTWNDERVLGWACRLWR